MKKFFSHNFKWIFLALLCFLLEGLAENRFNFQKPEEYYGFEIDKLIQKKKKEFEEIRQDDSLMNKIRSKVFDEHLISTLRSKKVMALMYEDGDLTYWTSVAIDESIGAYKDSVGFGLAEIKRGWYLYDNVMQGKTSILLCYPLYRHYQISNNPLLDDGFNQDLNIRSKAEFQFVPGKVDDIRIGKQWLREPVYAHFINPEIPETPLYVKILFLLAVFFFSIFILHAFEYIEHESSFRWAWLFLGGMLLGLRALTQWLDYPKFLNEYGLFNPDLYSLNRWIPSLGDLLIDVLLGFILVFSAFKGTLLASRDSSRFNWKTLKRPLISTVILTGMLVGTAILLGALESLINDSALNFDITNILNSGIHTALGLLIAAMLLTMHFLGVNIIVIMVHRTEMKVSHLILYFLLSVALFIGLFLLSGRFDYVLTVQSISYLLAVYITYQLVLEQNYFQRIVAILFIVSVFASSLIYRTIHDKEKKYRMALAERIISPKDLNAESVFLDIETKLEYDGFIKNYFRSPVLQKSQLEKRIKQLYFTGYLSRYEMDIYDFDTLGNPFKEMNDFPYSYLEEVYNSRTQSTLSNHFYFVNDPTLRFGYIAKYEVCTDKATLGKLFILLKPKFVQDEKIFTELLSNTESQTDLSNYSYAIYQDGALINQSGAYPYSLKYDFRYVNSEQFVKREGYSHFLKQGEGGMIVVVSKKRDSFLEPLTIFSFLFLTFSLFTLLVFALNFLFMSIRIAVARFGGKRRQLAAFYSWMGRFLPYRKFRGLFFSTRIQLAMIGLVLVALLLTGYFTVQYINFKYSQRQNERLDSKVKSIISAIENERRFEEMMLYNDELAAYLNQLAEFYNTDINLFSLNGKLLASTQMRIFQSGVLLDRINPLAFAKIAHEARSQHIQTERVGKLEYLASYVPIFDGNHKLIAFMNVPFFSNEKELKMELTSFLENFINIYVFFFILAGIIAFLISQRITLPLTLIQSKLASTRLGNRNERLEWRQQDEIGQLVRQYNFMVDQMEKSAEILAKSEREDAWKEMAKQIAHEIKNPLTPMKLSVQHLQRAWVNKNDNLGQTFKRVTAVLIDQIDSLSLLATEFSSFAQMPTAKEEEFELSDVLTSVVELYFNSPDVDIHFSAEKERMFMVADKNQISRAFHNILKNAIQAIPENRRGRIEISLTKEGKEAMIRIADNGNGMPIDIASRIFTPSFSTKNSGMGLGLAITKQIIETSGGRIAFDTWEGKGTVFYIHLKLK
ncbi:MAG: GHKL domain-containing protein [Bacteroidetes bacterium]|nr:GHKL domain-containing protein [Bacteroidota bacterium]